MQATALVPPNYLTDVDDDSELADESSLDGDAAALVENIVRRRRQNRGGGALDMIVVVEDWACEDWSDYDITDYKAILARFVDDHSEDSIKVEDAHGINLDAAEGRTESAMDMSLGDLVDLLDHTEEDFHDAMGEMYLPKSAVDGIFRLDYE